jgi:hypothetical protein
MLLCFRPVKSFSENKTEPHRQSAKNESASVWPSLDVNRANHRATIRRGPVFPNPSREVAAVLANVAPTTYLATSASAKKNRLLVFDTLSNGGKILFGGLDEKEASTTSVQPTIVGNVTPEMDLYHTESFGPIASLHIVDTEDDAIALANDTQYGLTAAVHTQDLRRGFRVARRVESGYVAIQLNQHSIPIITQSHSLCQF